MEILEVPLITPLAFTPHPSLPPQAGEGVEAPSLARVACGVTSDLAAVFGSLVEWLVVSSRGLGRGCRWYDVIFYGILENSISLSEFLRLELVMNPPTLSVTQ